MVGKFGKINHLQLQKLIRSFQKYPNMKFPSLGYRCVNKRKKLENLLLNYNLQTFNYNTDDFIDLYSEHRKFRNYHVR
jgi:hypothetical protein